MTERDRNGTATDVGAYDHVRASADAPVPEGVYRVVGIDGEGTESRDGDGPRVTLLLVADPEGRRVNSGTVERVDREALEAFDAAENPDAGFSPSDLLDPFTAYASALRHWL